MKKKLFIFVCFVIFTLGNIFADKASDRKTALRYLQLANDYLVSSKWNEAQSAATLGLAYDDSVADLWYISAITYSETDANIKPSSIITLLETALQSEWVKFNPSSGKLFLAKYYIQTLEYEKALSLLNDNSLLVQSDSLKLKAKIAYLQGNKAEARQIIQRASKIFPKDADFPQIFFSNEDYQNQDENDSVFVLLKNQFLQSVLDFTDFNNRYNSDLLLNAVCFAEDNLKINLLKIVTTQGITNSLYYINALNANFISEQEAVSQFLDFSKNTINFTQLVKLNSLLTTPEAKKLVADYLITFTGECLFDLNGDSFIELKLQYKNGQPQFATFEQKQDGEITWVSTFDYGVPRTVQIADTTVSYARFPYISTIENHSGKFSFIPDSVQWVPFNIEKASDFEQIDFYILSIKNECESVDSIDLYNNCYAVRINVFENENAICKQDIIDGKISQATYTVENVPYAYAFFDDGIIKSRKIDFDNDGYFEAFVEYGVYDESNILDSAKLESKKLNLDLFGNEHFIDNLYIQKVYIDKDFDGVTDYFSSELQDGLLEKVWYLIDNSNGIVKTLENKDGDLLKTTYQFANYGELEVIFEESKPTKYVFNGKSVELIYDDLNNIYWDCDYTLLKDISLPQKLISSVNNDRTNQYEFKMIQEGYTTYFIVRTFDFYIVLSF